MAKSRMQQDMEEVQRGFMERPEIRVFTTGATRNNDTDKYDYEGFLSPLVVERFGQYMHKHRLLADGTLRASDNWQAGFPDGVCMKSLTRHVVDAWKQYRGYPTAETPEDTLCAIIFNAQAILFQRLGGVKSIVQPPAHVDPAELGGKKV